MRIRILVVDDHALVSEGLKSLVEEEADLEVVGHAEDGFQAIRKAVALRPNVVLMDVMMPTLNGIDATRVICERLPETRVIMVSMHSNPEYACRSIEAGASGYLLKRSAGRELLDAIRAVVSGRRYFSAQIAETVIERYVSGQVQKDPMGLLSIRERQVLQLLAESKTVADIAKLLNLSPKTVETYRARLFDKLGIRDLPALVRFAVRHGVISLD